VRLVNFGHLGDGNLHYNVQAPRVAMRQALPGRAGARGQHASCTTPWRFGGSISAEHGVGALKRDELSSASRRWR
jgi:FAD/FMN-containing dehydrogenase